MSVILSTGRGCLLGYPPGQTPPGQTPPWADSPPKGRHPHSRRLLLRTIRILLECILVSFKIWLYRKSVAGEQVLPICAFLKGLPINIAIISRNETQHFAIIRVFVEKEIHIKLFTSRGRLSFNVRAGLHQASELTLRQLYDDTSDTAVNENNGVAPECDCNLFSSDTTVFSENSIASVIAELS